MAFPVGTDLAALLTAASPDAGSRRTAASPVATSVAPPDFADLLTGLGQEDGTITDPAPTAGQPIMPAAAQGPRGRAAMAMEWPWASLAAAAEEATALAGQFQRPSADTAMPAGDAAVPEASWSNEPDEPGATPLSPAMQVVQVPSHPLPSFPLALPESEEAVASLMRPAPAPAAVPAAEPGIQVPGFSLTGHMEHRAADTLPAPDPAKGAAPTEAKRSDATMPGLIGLSTNPPAPATMPARMSASPTAASPAPAPEAAEVIVAEATVAATVPEPLQASSPPQRRPAEGRKSLAQDATTSASVAVHASHRDNPLPLPDELTAACGVVAPESPARPEASPILPRQSHVVPAAEAIMRMDPVAEAKAPAAEPLPPTPTTPEFRTEAPRQAASPIPARPHLPPEVGQQLALRVVTAAANRVESVSVDLRPPELGRVELRLTFHDGTVQVSMAAERGDTFEALRQDRVHLEQQMQQAGLQLSSGGLDLQHGHLPREAHEPPPTPPAPTEGTAATEDEAPPTRRPPSDSLIDLIA